MDKKYKEARENAGLRREEACTMLKVSFGTLINWETGKTKPDANNVRDMAITYGCTADYLLGLA